MSSTSPEEDLIVEMTVCIPTYGKPEKVRKDLLRSVVRRLFMDYGPEAFVRIDGEEYRWSRQGENGSVVRVDLCPELGAHLALEDCQTCGKAGVVYTPIETRGQG